MAVDGSRKHQIFSMMQSIKRYPYLCIGFALYWVWIVITLQGPLRYPLAVIGIPAPSWCLTLACGAIFYAVVSFRYKAYDLLATKKGWRFASCFAMFAGLALSTVWVAGVLGLFGFDVFFSTVIYSVGSITMGIGAAAVMMYFFRVYERLGVTIALFHGAVAMFCATCYQAVFTISNIPLVNMFLTPWFPLIIWLCFKKTDTSLMHVPYSVQPERRSEASLPRKPLVTVLIQGMGFGFGLGILLYWGNDYGLPQILGFLCAGIASILLLVTALSFKSDFTKLIYYVGFPLVAFGFLLMACSASLYVPGNVIQAIGSCYLYMVFICLFVYLAQAFGIPITRISGAGMCFLYLGQVSGGLLGVMVVRFEQMTGVSISTIASVMCFLLVLSALYISGGMRIELGWEGARPGTLGDVLDSANEGLRVMAVTYGLTSRETEVFVLAAQGKNKKSIGDDLCISEETAKTHLKSIYQKMDVHSQQELINAVHRR